MGSLLVFVAVVAAYGLLSRPLERLGVTAPLAFVAAGAAGHLAGLSGLVDVELVDPEVLRFRNEVVLVVAELALALTLFTDAAGVELSALRRRLSLPGRLLGVGLPLTIGLGLVAALPLLSGDVSFWEAAIIAAVLAPTDAALSATVLADRRVPVRLREALNVESGLNDGLAVPAVFVFIALADLSEGAGGLGYWSRFVIQQLGVGIIAGFGVAYLGGRALVAARRRSIMDEAYEPLVGVALAVLAWAAADWLGGSGFIAAFVGGLVAGAVIPDREALRSFMDGSGRLLVYAVFFAFGGAAAASIDQVTGAIVVYALVSLTVVRMVPVAIALARSRLGAAATLFLGWFGPRGLASIILAVVVVVREAPDLPGAGTIFLTMVVTVILSVVLHGLTAGPLTTRLAPRLSTGLDGTDHPSDAPGPDG